MRYNCLNCEMEFEAKLYVKYLKHGEQTNVKPIYAYQNALARKGGD